MTSIISDLEDAVDRLEIEMAQYKFKLGEANDVLLRVYTELSEDFQTDEDYMLGLIETYLEEE